MNPVQYLRVFVLFALALLLGCEPPSLLITPVSSARGLQESTIRTDAGLFVSDKIAVIDVDGPLFNSADTSLFGSGENPVSLFQEKLDRAAADDAVKAVVLRINSPGGSVSASDAMHHALKTFREKTDKPVVTCFLGLGASGAYYLACASDHILAQPGGIVGSIGVIFQTVSFSGTMSKLGISAEAIKSGDLKDLASPLEPLRPEEREVLKHIVMQSYESFLNIVLAGRANLSREKLLPLADGRVYTARDALDAGLVDRLGYPDDAVNWAKQLADVSRAKVVIYHRPAGYKPNLYASASAPNAAPLAYINLELPQWLRADSPALLYLWQPGR